MTTTAQRHTLEVVLFRTKPGVSDAELLVASDALQRDVEESGVYAGRRLLKGDGDRWIDVVDWTDREGAERAGAEIMQRPSARAFEALVVPESVEVLYFSPVRTYAPGAAVR